MHEELYGDCREKAGRERMASMGLIDSHMGLIIAIVVHAGNIQDRDGARLVLKKMFDNRAIIGRMQTILADGGYRGPKLGNWFSGHSKKMDS